MESFGTDASPIPAKRHAQYPGTQYTRPMMSTADQENKEQENIVLWNMSKNFMERYLHSVFFCIGIILIFWRSSECLQKYLYNNLSTKIRMDQSYSAVLPSIVLCSLKATAFNER